MLRPIYINKFMYCWFCQRLILSIEKVEKVVKPPQKPIMNTNFRGESVFSKEIRAPIIKHPKILTSKVPNGK